MKSPNKPDVLEETLANFAEEIVDYDQRMIKVQAPNIRFVHKYIKRAKQEILKHYLPKSQVKELVEEIKPEKREKYSDNAEKNYNFGYNHALDDFSKALIDKLGEDK